MAQAATGKRGGKENAPYNLAPDFERAVTVLACTTPRFMARVGHEVRADLLGLPECKLAFELAQSIYRDKGVGPAVAAAVIQAAASKREDGKANHEEVMAVAGLFDTFDGKDNPKAADFEEQLVGVIKKRLRFEMAQAAVAEHGEEGWERVRELMRREEALGNGEAGVGIIGTPDAMLAALERLRNLKRVPYGITALDEAMEGGAPRGTLTCFMAGPGGAKSMTMSHCAGQLGMLGLQVAYATLELPAEQVISRIIANQTGFTINEVIQGNVDAQVRMAFTVFKPVPPVVQDFEPYLTTPEVITDWVGKVVRHTGRAVDVLIIDYADKLSVNGKAADKSNYQEMGTVYEKLRIYCNEVGLVGITASQSRARDDSKKGKVGDISDVADSMHKARVVDQFITLNVDDDTREMLFFLAKNRYGDGRKKAGPVPTNFACGQVAPVVRADVNKLGPRLPILHAPPPGLDAALEAAASRAGVVEAAMRLGSKKAADGLTPPPSSELDLGWEPGSDG
jgi:KaiC/GvpD/RAD55 family RecA-like ATPase